MSSVSVFYGTGRARAQGRDADRLDLGICEVTIASAAGAPSHVSVQSVIPLPQDRALAYLRQHVERSTRREAFVLVHGSDVGLDEACRRTAQRALATGLDSVATMFSRPSPGPPARAAVDTTRLQEFVELIVARSGAASVHLVTPGVTDHGLLARPLRTTPLGK